MTYMQQVMDVLEKDLESLGASCQTSWDLTLSVIAAFDGTEYRTLSGYPSPVPRTSTPKPGLVLDVPDVQMVLVSTPGSASDAATPRNLVSLVPNMDTSHQGTNVSTVPSNSCLLQHLLSSILLHIISILSQLLVYLLAIINL